MQLVDVVLIGVCILAGFFIFTLASYFFALRQLKRSFKTFESVAHVADHSDALKQSIFQLYKELTVHNAITIGTCERFKSEFKKTLVKNAK